MIIQAINAFSYVDDGEVFSIAHGAIVDMDDTLAQGFIDDGLAEVYTPAMLYTSLNITENDTYDVAQYASAVVNVPNPSTGSITVTTNGTYDVTEKASVVVDVDVLTVTYDANGGTGTVAAVNVAAGDSITLSDGTGLTAPEGKEFAGWATEATAEEPDVTSPYTPSASVTLHAVYTAVTPEG